jgi:hypothetical protein
MPTPRKSRAAAAAPAVDVIEPGEQWQQPAGTVLQLALPPEETEDEPDIPQTAADRIAAMLQGATGDERARVKLYRIPAPGKFEWCEDYTPEDFERGGEALIRSKWGAGEYMVRLYGTTIGKSGSAGYGVRAADTIRIAADSTSPNPTAAMPAGIAQAIEAMAANQKQMLEAMSARPAAPDPMAQMMQMLSMMELMREATGETGGSKQRGVGELLRELRDLKDLGADLIGGKSDEPADPLTSALPGLLDIIKGAQGQQGMPPVSPPQLGMPPVSMPPSIANATQEPATVPTVTDPAQALALVQRKLKTLMALAAANVDPEEGAQIVYEHLPDELIDVLRAGTWFESLCQFAPEAAPHREWLDKARVIALDWIDNPPQEGEDDPGPGDDAAPQA